MSCEMTCDKQREDNIMMMIFLTHTYLLGIARVVLVKVRNSQAAAVGVNSLEPVVRFQLIAEFLLINRLVRKENNSLFLLVFFSSRCIYFCYVQIYCTFIIIKTQTRLHAHATVKHSLEFRPNRT